MFPSGPDVASVGAPVPGRALVVPRVRTQVGGAALPLERHISGILAAGGGVVNLYGPSGSGKSTAIEHLSSLFHNEPRLRLIDRNVDEILVAPAGSVVVYTTRKQSSFKPLVLLQMAQWTQDDCIQYLAATHRGRVGAVMGRTAADPDSAALDGSPELWRVVLDVMAADDNVAKVSAALTWYVGLEAPNPAMRDAAASFCLDGLQSYDGIGVEAEVATHLDVRVRRLIRHRAVRVPLASECIAAALLKNTAKSILVRPLPDDVLAQVARLVASEPAALGALERTLRSGPPAAHANAAGILNAARAGWRPEGGVVLCLHRAVLKGARWSGVNLIGCDLTLARLQNADLTEAKLDHSTLVQANLRGASLSRASLRSASCGHTNFSDAKLEKVCAVGADFSYATLIDADLRAADFKNAILDGACLDSTRCSDTVFAGASLEGATIEDADFSDADFTQARLVGLSFQRANFTGARFAGANLTRAHIEYCGFPAADFSHADLTHTLLTGARMPGANFRGAKLKWAGLADVEWEGADLRRADLTGASFHAGSTRSGLVGSVVPCEGSRTGFYTDDFHDRDFKPPEEIRKANLRNADLRGAKIAGVDFYLVDLRGARCTGKQIKYLRQCGAILGGRKSKK